MKKTIAILVFSLSLLAGCKNSSTTIVKRFKMNRYLYDSCYVFSDGTIEFSLPKNQDFRMMVVIQETREGNPIDTFHYFYGDTLKLTSCYR